MAAKKEIVEERWRKFFADPSQWWDQRSEKQNAGYADFNHRKTADDKWRPSWVEVELAAMAPGTVKLSTFSRNVELLKFGEYEKAVEVFHQMQRDGNKPDKFTFTRVLNACASLKILEEGRLIHRQILQSGCESEVFVRSSLIDTYAKCGSIDDARALFDSMPSRNVVSWNATIWGHFKCEEGRKAVRLYRRMKRERVEPNPVTFLGLLSACASLEDLKEGRRVHAQIFKSGYESECSSLLAMLTCTPNVAA